MADKINSKGRSKGAGGWQIAAIWVGGILALIATLLGIIFVLIDTTPGHHWLVGRVNRALESQGITIGAIEGSIFDRFTLRDFAIADGKGTWLAVEKADITWRPLSLLQGDIAVSALDIDMARWARIPESDTDTEPEAQPDSGANKEGIVVPVPEMPMDILIERLDISRFELGADLFNHTAAFRIDGRLTWPRCNPSADLSIVRLDRAEESARVDIDLTAGGMLRLDLAVEAAAGGLLPALMDLPGSAVGGRIVGEGLVEDWTGTLDLRVSEIGALRAHVRRIDQELRLDGRVLEIEILAAELASELGLPGEFQLAYDSAFQGPEPRHLTLDVRTAAASLSLDGRVALFDRLAGDLSLKADLVEASLVRAYWPGFEFDSITLTGRVAGNPDSAAIDATVSIGRPQFPDVSADMLIISAHSQWGGPTMPLSATANVTALSLAGAPEGLEIPRDGDLTLTGTWRTDGGHLSVERVRANAGPLRLDGRGTVETVTQEFSAQGQLDVTDLAALLSADSPIREGRLTVTAEAARSGGGPLIFNGAATAGGLALADETLKALAGSDVRAEAGGRLYEDGRLELDTLGLEGAAVDLTASARRAVDGALSGSYTLAFNALERIDPKGEFQLAGGATVAGAIGGNERAPEINGRTTIGRIDIQNLALASVAAEFEVSLPEAGPRGRARLQAASRLGPVRADVPFAQEADGAVRFRDVSLSFSRLTFQGSGRYTPGSPIEADIAIATEPMDAGDPGRSLIRGEVSGRLSLEGIDGVQHGVAGLSVQSLTVPIEQAFLLSVNDLSLSAEGRLAGGRPEGSLSVEMADASYGFDRLDSLSLTADATPQSAEIRIAAGGDVRGPLDMVALVTGQFDADRQRWQADLNGTVAGVPIMTALRPDVTVDQAGWRLSPFALQVGSGALRGRFVAEGDDYDGEAQLADFDLAVLRTAVPELPARGLAGGRVDIERASGVTTGDFNLIFNDLEPVTESFAAGEGLDIGLAANLAADRLESIFSIEGAELYGGARAYLPVEQTGARIGLDREQAIQAELVVQGNVGPAFTLLGLAGQDLAGLIDIQASAAGTLNSPDISGALAVSDAVYEHFDSGFVARQLQASARFDGSALTVEQIRATDGNSGTMNASGTVILGGEEFVDADINLNLDRFTVVRRSDVTARSTANLNFRQRREASNLAGDIRIDRAEVGLVETGPEAVPTMRVREVYGEDAPALTTRSRPPDQRTRPVNLDLRIGADERIFVRGRGLDSEWRGNLTVTGTSQDPVINGQISVVRGHFDFAGNRFELVEGDLRFDGGRDVDPELSIEARRELEDITAIIRVTGRLSNPEIAISADPALPEDEVISRVLFGRSIQQLSALEAVQLAGALATLTGGGGGLDVLGMARSTIGLDRLTVDVGPETGTTVTGGKYLTDDVYLELSTATSTGETSGSVRWELTRNLSLLSKLGTGKDSSLSIRWSWDY